MTRILTGYFLASHYTKMPDSDGFCGFQKMLKGVDFQSLRLCAVALSFYSLTQRYDVGTRDYYTREGYCYRPQKTLEPGKCP